MNADESRNNRISRIAKSIYFKASEKGFPNDPARDWSEAEKIYSNKFRYYLWWLPSEYLGENNYRVLLFATACLFLIVTFGIKAKGPSYEFTSRPYVSVNILNPLQIIDESGKNTYYGSYIILKNNGKTPAANVTTKYYMTTNLDKEKLNYSRWINEKVSGVGILGFIAPGAIQKEPSFRSLSPSARYYYFEAVTSYEGINPGKRYWTRIKKVFYIDRETGDFYPVSFSGEWDRNRDFTAPALSSEQEISVLLDKIERDVARR